MLRGVVVAVLLVDLPLSAVGDTLTLPYTAARTLAARRRAETTAPKPAIESPASASQPVGSGP